MMAPTSTGRLKPMGSQEGVQLTDGPSKYMLLETGASLG